MISFYETWKSLGNLWHKMFSLERKKLIEINFFFFFFFLKQFQEISSHPWEILFKQFVQIPQTSGYINISFYFNFNSFSFSLSTLNLENCLIFIISRFIFAQFVPVLESLHNNFTIQLFKREKRYSIKAIYFKLIFFLINVLMIILKITQIKIIGQNKTLFSNIWLLNIKLIKFLIISLVFNSCLDKVMRRKTVTHLFKWFQPVC